MCHVENRFLGQRLKVKPKKDYRTSFSQFITINYARPQYILEQRSEHLLLSRSVI